MALGADPQTTMGHCKDCLPSRCRWQASPPRPPGPARGPPRHFDGPRCRTRATSSSPPRAPGKAEECHLAPGVQRDAPRPTTPAPDSFHRGRSLKRTSVDAPRVAWGKLPLRPPIRERPAPERPQPGHSEHRLKRNEASCNPSSETSGVEVERRGEIPYHGSRLLPAAETDEAQLEYVATAGPKTSMSGTMPSPGTVGAELTPPSLRAPPAAVSTATMS